MPSMSSDIGGFGKYGEKKPYVRNTCAKTVGLLAKMFLILLFYEESHRI